MEKWNSTLARLSGRVADLGAEWGARQPFRYLIIDDFLAPEFADEIYAAYAEPDGNGWDSTTYLHQRNKFTRTANFPAPIEQFFALTASEELRKVMTRITGIENLLPDPELLGGGAAPDCARRLS